jgi:hypothetical protein
MLLQPSAALEAFVKLAEPGSEFVYCEAPSPMYGETWSRATELAQQGFVRTHQRRRAGGGWQWYAVRTTKPLPKERTAQERALDNGPTLVIYTELKRAAILGRPCPTDGDLMKKAGLDMRQAASWRVRRLIDVGLISSTVAYENGVPTRVVTIETSRFAGAAAGKFTALPKKWAALQAAAARDASSAAATAGGAK